MYCYDGKIQVVSFFAQHNGRGKTMLNTEVKKIILISSVSLVAAFGLSACGDDKASAPAAVEEKADDVATPAPSAMDDATKAASEMVEEVVEEVKEKAEDAMDEAATDAMDEAKKKAEEEMKKKMPQ